MRGDAWLLAVDLGGTRLRWMLRGPDGRLVRGEASSRTGAAPLQPLLETLGGLPDGPPRPLAAVLAVAGPVRGGRARLTNLGVELDEERLRARLGAEALRLVNDVQGAAAALPRLPRERLRPLGQPGAEADPDAAELLVMVGTGLGAALWRQGRAWPTEAGHVAFAPRTGRQRRFARWLRATEGLATLERVAAGPSLARWYRFLGEQEGIEGDSEVADRVAAAADPAAEVGLAALEGRCPRAREAVGEALRALGHGLRDLLLATLPEGGAVLGGGVAARLAPLLPASPLLGALREAGPMAELLRELPIWLCTDEELGLRGALRLAERLTGGPAP